MGCSESTVFHRLFSHKVTFSVFILTCTLLMVTGATYLGARDRKDVSLTELRLAYWSLIQLRHEATAFDHQLIFATSPLAQPKNIKIKYDILWSRFNYLLTSDETYAIRTFNDNVAKIDGLFSQLKKLDSKVSNLSHSDIEGQLSEPFRVSWENIYSEINKLVIENMIGGATGNLTQQFDQDLGRFAQLRMIFLLLLGVGFLYFIFTINFLKKQFGKDPLTNLPNRHYFSSKNSLNKKDLYFVLQIRNFQQIQTEHGGTQADNLIRHCAAKLAACISDTDTLIHLSYGEFVIVKRSSHIAPEEVISNIIDRSSFDWNITRTAVPIHFAAGGDPGNPKNKGNRIWLDRHHNALRALNYSLLSGKPFCIANDQLLSEFDFRAEVLGELVRYFRGEPAKIELSIVYQPIVNIDKNRKIAGMEALLRGKLRDEIAVPPNLIVDICEAHGLGSVFGEWLFNKIGSEASQMFHVFRFKGFLSINLNPSLITEDLPDLLKRTIIAKGIDARHICLEITEDNASMDFNRTIPLMKQVRAIGVTFALDDFGTGYSSLEYLHRLPIDKLKIDRYFVNDIELNSSKSQFLKGILGLAQKMSIQTVVEGIENQHQWDIVARHEADLAQGYLTYRPMNLNDVLSILVDEAVKLSKPPATSSRVAFLGP